MDSSAAALLVVLGLAVVGSLLWAKLRYVPPAPECGECGMAMEQVEAALEPERLDVGSRVTDIQARPRRQYYFVCPRCQRGERVSA
jgi:ribosomal protein L34E